MILMTSLFFEDKWTFNVQKYYPVVVEDFQGLYGSENQLKLLAKKFITGQEIYLKAIVQECQEPILEEIEVLVII